MSKQHCLFITSADHDIAHNLARFIAKSELKDQFKEVVCGGVDQERMDDLKREGLKVVQYNLQDRQSLVKHFKGMDVVYVVPPFRKEEPRAACHLIDACKEAKVNCVLLQSNLMCEQANMPMMKQYQELERYLMEQSHIKHKAVVRVGHVSDTFLYIARHIQENGEIPLPTGDKKFAPIQLRDVSRATAILLTGKKHQQGQFLGMGPDPSFPQELNHHKIELTGPESLNGNEIVRRASDAIGAQFKFRSIDVKEAEKILHESEELDKMEIKLILEEYELIKQGKYDHVSKDYEKIVGRQASKVDEFFEENARNFKPQK